MELFALILVSFFDVLVLYVLLRLFLFCFAESEIKKSAFAEKNGDMLVIYAKAESLEYYVKMGLLLGRGTKITVRIDKDSGDSEELLYIAGALSKRHGNITVNYL